MRGLEEGGGKIKKKAGGLVWGGSGHLSRNVGPVGESRGAEKNRSKMTTGK